jgi:hypothetical protein
MATKDSDMIPVVRISVSLLDDPSDVLVSETEHELVTYRDAGDRLRAGVTYEGAWLSIPIDEATLDAWWKKENAEAMVP